MLAREDPVVGVFTRSDAARGRGLAVVSPPVKQLAEEHGIPVVQPRTWKDGTALETFASFRPDLAIVAAYGRLLPQAALDLPRFGCINVHGSLLPRWRGADPIRRALLEGDAETGVTIMRMVLEMDAGPMLWKRSTRIEPDDTGGGLELRLAELGGEALVEALDRWRAGTLGEHEQDAAAVTYAPPLQKEDGRVDWTRTAAEIERAARAFSPWPGASTLRRGAPLQIWRALVVDASPAASGSSGTAAPGTVLATEAAGPLVATGRGSLRLLEVQAAGKRRMAASDWSRGARLEIGERLG